MAKKRAAKKKKVIVEIARVSRLANLGVTFWQFQKDFIKDPGRFIAVMWARGNGKSLMTALKITLESFDNEARGNPSNWLIVSATAAQAKEALRLVEGWSRIVYAIAIESAIIEVDVEFQTPDGLERYTRYELRLGKNTRIMALSASPAAIRGNTCNVWWDEACFFANDHDMWATLQHCTRGRLKAIVTSTPIGGNERRFHEIMHDTAIVRGNLLWSKHTCDIYRAIAEGRIYDLESEKAASKKISWAQEMELQWVDGAETWFKQELISECEDPQASVIGHGHSRGRCFIGNDLGLRGDKWCAWVLEATSDFGVHYDTDEKGRPLSWYTGELITREVVVLDTSKFADHDREMARLMHKYNVNRLCMDQGGMGEKPTEDYIALYGASKVEGILFNVENKGSMALLGLELMTDRRVLLPQNQPEITADLRKLQKTVTAGGAIRFNASRDKNGHADRCWALLMACNAAITPCAPVEYESADTRDSYYDMQDFVWQ